jgi:hypothetical protein
VKRTDWAYLDQRDLALAGVIALAALAAVSLEVTPVLRVALAVPLVLFLPGYAVGAALLPSRSLEPIERFLVSLGLSFGLTILVGIALGLSPAGLGPLSWAVSLAGVTLVGCLVALARRVRARIAGPGFARPVVPLGGALLILLASVLLADVLLGARLVALQQEAPAPEQLWMLRGDAPEDVRLGVRAGPGGGEYTVRLSSAGELVQRFDLELAEGETWQTLASVPAEATRRPLVARLYRAGSEIELRFVVLQPESP